MTTELTLAPQSLDLMSLGKVLATSGYFQDARDAGQAIVKVLAGQELGFGPIASMTGIYIVKGRVTLSANLIAAAIKRSGRYNYRVLRLDNEGCEIEFCEGGKPLGTSSFTDADAKAAGLSGENWSKYRRNMMFARAISNGAKWFCPDVFGGPVYTPDELGSAVDGETGEIIDVTPTKSTPPPPPPEPPVKAAPATNGHTATRPLSAEAVRETCRKRAGWVGSVRAMGKPITVQQLGALPMLMDNVMDGSPTADQDRHNVMQFLFGVTSTKDLTTAEASALIAWLKEPGDGWEPNEYAQAEVAAVLNAWAIEAGQQVLL